MKQFPKRKRAKDLTAEEALALLVRRRALDLARAKRYQARKRVKS